MQFSVNMLFKRMLSLGATEEDSQYSMERVLWIDPSHTFLYTIDCDVQHRNAWPLARRIADLEGDLRSGLISLVAQDPYQYIYQEDEAFAPDYVTKRDESWELVQEILSRAETPGMLFDPRTLGPIISKIHKSTGKAKTTLYRLLRYYWQKGQVKNALLPNFDLCGAPGKTRGSGSAKRGRPSKKALENGVPTGVNIDDTDKGFFRQGIQLNYETRECKTLKEAWLRTLAKFYAVGEKESDGVKTPFLPEWEKLPTENQFRYWYYKEYHPVRAIVKRKGEHAYTVNSRAARGSLRLRVFGPGSIYIIDATVGDIYLVSEMDRNRIIGRPVIYIIIDVFSGLIVGMSVLLEGPSWLGAMQALENIVLDKVAFCKENGRTIRPEEWPSASLPHSILADRGELLSPRIEKFMKKFHISVANTAPYRPDWKGELEHQFHLINNIVIHWQPGAVREREPGRPDHRLDATHTLRSFRRLLIDYIIEHNTIRKVNLDHIDPGVVADGINPFPCELWKWGVKNRSGILRKESLESVRLALLPEDTARVTRDGIHFRNLHYTCQLAEQEDWAGQVKRGKPSWPVPIIHDPRSSDHIVLRLNDGKDLEVCTVVEKERRYRRWDWFDVEEYFAVRSQRDQGSRSYVMQQKVKHLARRDAITQEETEATLRERDASLSNAQRTGNIKQNRDLENQKEHQQHAWKPGGASKPPSAKRRPPATGSTEQFDILREATEELYGRK